MPPFHNHNGSRKRKHQERNTEWFSRLTLFCQGIRSKHEREMYEEWDQIQIEQAKQASLADYAKSIATPGSQLEAELKEDTYDTVPPQGGVEQYSEHSLPDAPGFSANYNEYSELSDNNETDDEEMPPLVRASELKENSPDVDTLLRHKPSNNTSIKIDRLSIKVEPKNITHSTKFPSGLRKVQTPEADEPVEETMARKPKTYKPSTDRSSEPRQPSPGPIPQSPADPKGYPPKDYDPDKPFPLLKCKKKVRHRILQHILTEPEPIIPYYYEGCFEGTVDEVTRENFPIPMLLALAGKDNRKYYEEARDIFYGWNRWKLTNPRVSRWWLKHIGDNVKSLSNIGIVLSQGIKLNAGTKGTWEEKLWHDLLVWLKTHHNLSSIWVTFEHWDNRLVEGMHPNQYPPVRDARIGVVRNLLGFRGLELAGITPGPYVHQQDTDLIKRAMKLKEGEHDSDVEARHRQLMPAVQKYDFVNGPPVHR